MKPLRTANLVTVLVIFSISCHGAAWAQTTLLHEFPIGAAGDIRFAPAVDSTSVYGTTVQGGTNGQGSLFKVDIDGTNFQVLHDFTGGADDGTFPSADLTRVGTTLYGVTSEGGDNDLGTVFKINTDGSGFELLHEFAGGATGGAAPVRTPLLVDGGSIFGMTGLGGTNSLGTLYRMGLDGSGFQLLHTFTGGSGNGETPFGGLALSGSTLVGTTFGGGNNAGTVFKINTDGTDFDLLHQFTGTGGDGRVPQGSVAIVGNTVYGTTIEGGNNNNEGVLFSVDLDGTNYDIVHTFGGVGAGTIPSDAKNPEGGVRLLSTTNGDFLVGTGFNGGVEPRGAVFGIRPDGTDYEVAHQFTGPPDDGANPANGVVMNSAAFFGATQNGGQSNGGTIYRIDAPGPALLLDRFEGFAINRGSFLSRNAGFERRANGGGGDITESAGTASITTSTVAGHSNGIISVNTFDAVTDSDVGFRASWEIDAATVSGSDAIYLTLQSANGYFDDAQGDPNLSVYIPGGNQTGSEFIELRADNGAGNFTYSTGTVRAINELADGFTVELEFNSAGPDGQWKLSIDDLGAAEK